MTTKVGNKDEIYTRKNICRIQSNIYQLQILNIQSVEIEVQIILKTITNGIGYQRIRYNAVVLTQFV